MASLAEVITELQQSQDDLLEISMESLDTEDRSHQTLTGIYDCLKSIEDVLVEATIQLYDFFDMQSDRVDTLRELQSSQNLENLEREREEPDDSEKPQKESEKSLAEKITPSKGLFDIASKFLMGTAVFWMLNNIEEVEAFVNDQLVPAIKSTFNFMKDTVFPFLTENFDVLLKGLIGLAGVIVGGKIISSMIGAGTKVVSAIKSVMTAFKVVRAFMLTTFIPGLVGMFSSMLASLTPILVAAAPFVAIGIAVGAALFGLYKLLEHLKEKFQFDSIGDLLMFGVLKLKDSFARVGNLIIDVVNKFGSLLEAGAKLLGQDIDLPELQRMETDSAEEFKRKKDEERELREKRSLSESNTVEPSTLTREMERTETVSEPEIFRSWFEILPKPKPVTSVETGLPEGVIMDSVSGKYIATNKVSNKKSMFETVDEAKTFVNAPLEEAVKLDSNGTIDNILTERKEQESQLSSNFNDLRVENTAPRSIQTEQLNTATTENQVVKSEMNNAAPTIVAPSTNNNVVNNNMKQTVSMPMPTASDGSDRYAPLFGAR